MKLVNGKSCLLKISPGEVADNIPHTARFVFNTDENTLNVFFDGERRPQQEVSLGGIQPGKTLFNGQVYLGGYPNYDLLPWRILSRSGFIGCVEELQVKGYADNMKYGGQTISSYDIVLNVLL